MSRRRSGKFLATAMLAVCVPLAALSSPAVSAAVEEPSPSAPIEVTEADPPVLDMNDAVPVIVDPPIADPEPEPVSSGVDAAPSTNDVEFPPAETDRIVVTAVSAAVSDATVENAVESVTENVTGDAVVNADVVRDTDATTTIVQLDGMVSLSDLESVAESLEATAAIVQVEPDVMIETSAASPGPNDFDSSQWGLWNGPLTGSGGFSSRAFDANTNTPGAGVIVGILDSGHQPHPELAGQTVAGYDFVTDIADAMDGDGRDPNPTDEGDPKWHGIHMAGIVSALTNNGMGIASVAPSAKIMPVRTVGKKGYMSDVADGISWASDTATFAGIPRVAKRADILNLSVSGPSDTCWSYLQAAIDKAVTAGVTVVVSAGNGGLNPIKLNPANCKRVIVVTSHDQDGAPVWSANRGPTVDISAPGKDIKSLAYTGKLSATRGEPSYRAYTGTSQATAFVTGAAAILKSRMPNISPAEIEMRLKQGARSFTTTSGCTISTCGAGYLDIPAAMNYVAPPTTLTAVSSNTSMMLSWTAPATLGGLAPSRYLVSIHDPRTPSMVSKTSVTGTRVQISSLAAETSYVIEVRAMLGVNESSPTRLTAATLKTLTPNPVQLLAAGTIDDNAFNVRWYVPAKSATGGDSPVTGYQVQYSRDGITWMNGRAAGTSTFGSVIGLSPGTAYVVRVAAENAAGLGPWSTIRVTTNTVHGSETSQPVIDDVAYVAQSKSATMVWWGNSRTYEIEVSTDWGKTWSALTTTDTPSMVAPWMGAAGLNSGVFLKVRGVFSGKTELAQGGGGGSFYYASEWSAPVRLM